MNNIGIIKKIKKFHKESITDADKKYNPGVNYVCDLLIWAERANEINGKFKNSQPFKFMRVDRVDKIYILLEKISNIRKEYENSAFYKKRNVINLSKSNLYIRVADKRGEILNGLASYVFGRVTRKVKALEERIQRIKRIRGRVIFEVNEEKTALLTIKNS